MTGDRTFLERRPSNGLAAPKRRASDARSERRPSNARATPEGYASGAQVERDSRHNHGTSGLNWRLPSAKRPCNARAAPEQCQPHSITCLATDVPAKPPPTTIPA